MSRKREWSVWPQARSSCHSPLGKGVKRHSFAYPEKEGFDKDVRLGPWESLGTDITGVVMARQEFEADNAGNNSFTAPVVGQGIPAFRKRGVVNGGSVDKSLVVAE